MANGILIFGEVRGGTLKSITRELASAARQLSQSGGGDIALALIGEGIDQVLGEAKSLPVARVYTAKHALLDAYSSQGYAAALAEVIKTSGANIVLFGATTMGRDLSARTAARCGASLFVDCTELSLNNGALHAKRPVYSGKAQSSACVNLDPIDLVVAQNPCQQFELLKAEGLDPNTGNEHEYRLVHNVC